MYNVNCVRVLENKMKKMLTEKEHYLSVKNNIAKLEKNGDLLQRTNEIKSIFEKAGKIDDKSSDEYLELVDKAKALQKEYNSLYALNEIAKVKEVKIENIKIWILNELRKNKAILEKYYKDAKNDKDIQTLENKIKNNDEQDMLYGKINAIDGKIEDIERKIDQEELSMQEAQDAESKENANIKEQYLHDKKELEKYEKIKYVALVGNEIPKKRIEQYQMAIEYVEKEFDIEKIEDIVSNLQEILDIQKQNAKMKFDVKTHEYIYTDPRGKQTVFSDVFEKGTNGKYNSKLTNKDIKDLQLNIIHARGKDLSRKQLKSVDYNLLSVLYNIDINLVDNYLNAIKEGEKPDFDIEYDLRQKGMEKEERLSRKALRAIKKSAINQNKEGIAKVIKDKSKAKFAGILAAIGLTGAASFIGGNQIGHSLEDGANNINTERNTEGNIDKENINDEKETEDIRARINVVKNDSTEKGKEPETSTVSILNNDETENEIKTGDNVKILENAMVFSSPTDYINIKNGINANEKVEIKKSSLDKIYKITKVGYYSVNGEFVEVQEGENLEEALKNKGLDDSFINDENTVVMYHTVSDGIAQWVNADDTEKVNTKENETENKVDEQQVIDDEER